MSYDTLLLNTDGQPLTVSPLSTLSWQESIKLVILERIHVLEWHEDWVIHSQHMSFNVPSVATTKVYVRPNKTGANFSRYNVYARDNYQCQYCFKHFKYNDLTLDHVLPKSLGGDTSWENIVTSCKKCNYDKGNDASIIPKYTPYRPHIKQLKIGHKQLKSIKYPEWFKYLDIPAHYHELSA